MNTATRVGVILLCVGLAGAMLLPPLLRGSGSAASVSRKPEEIDNDLVATGKELEALMPTMDLIADNDFRKENGSKVLPLLKKQMSLFEELEKADPSAAASAHTRRLRLASYASVFGDAPSTKLLEDLAKSNGPDAVAAAADLRLSRWLLASRDASAQGKILDDMTLLAKDNSRHSEVVNILYYMARVGSANNDLAKKAIEIIRAHILHDGVQDLLKSLDARQAMIGLVGNSLSFEARTTGGSTFRLADYKGKVVIVDFWATWCVPCVAQMPELKALYKEYHDKGLEIVGISSDDTDTLVNDFVKTQSIPWPQLREQAQSAEDNIHPLAKKYGGAEAGLPRVFLVDRAGIVRYVDAHLNLKEKVAELMKEPAKP